eukprot:15440355-Alexandrium_andersonii.AAC.1
MTKPTPRPRHSVPDALEREVGAEANLLVLRGRGLILREAVQAVEVPEGARSGRSGRGSEEGLAGCAHEDEV